jgi:hypothetical protein
MNVYAKALMYIALTAVGFLATALTDNALSTEEVLNLAIMVIGAVGVYAVPNLPEGWRSYSKTIIAAVTAGLVALLSFLTDGVTAAEWMQVVVAAFAGVGVFIAPNQQGAASPS